MLFLIFLLHDGAVGADEIEMIGCLVLLALLALHLALRMPRLPEYQRERDESSDAG